MSASLCVRLSCVYTRACRRQLSMLATALDLQSEEGGSAPSGPEVRP